MNVAIAKYCPFCGAAALAVARRFIFKCGACGMEFAIASPQFVDVIVAGQEASHVDLQQPLEKKVIPSITDIDTNRTPE